MSELTVGSISGLAVNNNVVTVPSGHKLYHPGAVIQTKTTEYSTFTIYSVASYTTITSLSITPTKTTSQILFGFSFVVSGIGGFQITRNGSSVWSGPIDATGPYTYYENPNNQTAANSGSPRRLASYQFIDNPASTSELTYAIQIRPYTTAAASQIAVCEKGSLGNSSVGYVYVQEIAQ